MLRIAMLSYHICPLATLGGKDTGGMNVYVRELTRQLGQMGIHVDVFTRSRDEHVPHVVHELGYGNRVVHVPAGPEVPLAKRDLAGHLPQFVEGIKQFAAEKEIQYDLIHSHYWMSGIAAMDLKTAWGVPVIHRFHTLGLMKQRVASHCGEERHPLRGASHPGRGRCARGRGTLCVRMPSGAGHDAQSLAAAGVPVGMIFVPCRRGVSHRPEEWIEPTQATQGCQVLLRTLLELPRLP